MADEQKPVATLAPEWGEQEAGKLLASGRQALREGHSATAASALREAARLSRSPRTLTGIASALRQLRRQGPVTARRQCRVALVGTVTLDFFAPILDAACYAAGIDAEWYVGPFGQYRQEILDPQSGLARFRPDVVFLLADWRSLGLPAETADAPQQIETIVESFSSLWRAVRKQLGALVVQANFEIPGGDAFGRLSAVLPGGRVRLLRGLNLALEQAAAAQPGVAVLDLEQLASEMGKNEWNDSALWLAGKQYPSTAALPLLARALVGCLRALLGLSSKCLVLDLDGTLWGGIIGEDGMRGIALGGNAVGEAYVAFQRWLLELRSSGIPLAVCSKNNEADAQQVFREHPEMILRLDDIAVFVANWEPKHDNLREIAKSLNIGLDSLVFLDDNPAERALIRQLLPEVEVPELPADPSRYAETLAGLYLFESLSLTDEDRARAAAYRQNADRAASANSAGNLDEYLRNLDMRVELLPFNEANLPRIVQLINKTNQFNLTTTRMTELQVRELMNRPDVYTQSMRLRDSFGDNGLTGVLFAREDGETMRIENWLISCRVLGRRVEELMLARCLRSARARGLRWAVGEYIPTAKNGQVADVYTRFGFTADGESPANGRLFRWDLQQPFPEPDCFQVRDETAQGASVPA